MNAEEKKQTSERTAVYVRVAQMRPDESVAAERQRQDCLELCDRLGLEPASVHEDIGTSAWRGGHRPGFETLLESIKGGTSRVVVWRIDMLYRHHRDLERILGATVTRPLRVDCVSGLGFDLDTAVGQSAARCVATLPTRDDVDVSGAGLALASRRIRGRDGHAR